MNRTAEPDDCVTQFEALTAAAYHELARRGVEVAVIEAGLGGRFDATNVIPSKVQVLTSVGLEHTRWLGPAVTDIAAEKLAVVRDQGTLVIGQLDPESLAVAERITQDRHARLVRAGADLGVDLRAAGGFQRTNFAIAAAAAEAFLDRPLERRAVARAAAETTIPGRVEIVSDHPAHGLRRRPQPGRCPRPGRVARRGSGAAAPARGRDRRARGQGRRRDARRAAPARGPRRLHALAEPALAVARHARDARREARRPARRDGLGAGRGGQPRPGSSPGRPERCSSQARST